MEKETIKIFEQHHFPGISYKDPNYHTIQLNACENSDMGFEYRDNIGDNISERNFNYVDLTGVYWIWKNVHDCTYKGNVHYKRFFMDSDNEIMSSLEMLDILQEYDIIVCNFARLEGRTVYQIYHDFHGSENMDACKEVISDICPEYLKDFDDVIVNGEYSSLYNMMIAKNSIFDTYCEWLFSVLFELEKRLKKLDKLTFEDGDYQRKVFGFLGERLLLVWLKHNDINYIEVPVGVFDENLSYTG